MLKLVIAPTETFNERENEFETFKGSVLSIEHSLISVSKWESEWCVPFLSKRDKTPEEVIHYIKCMTLSHNIPDEVYYNLKPEHFEAIKEYIDAPMTATTIKERPGGGSREIITSELIYYWMVALNVPFECQKWHLNRLLMLINICSIKQEKPKKLRGKKLARRNSALNAQRRARLGSGG